MKQRFTSIQPSADLPQLLALLATRQPPEGEKKNQTWYSITNLSKTETEVFIYDEIGYWGITASDFVRDFSEIKTNAITLRINSPGGDVFDGVAIYNAVARHKATVDVFIDGVAASAASFIAMAGDTITMSPYSQMMIHEASGMVIGPSADMRAMADFLDKASDNIASIYAARAGGLVEEWRALMTAETWFSDKEAVANGLADGITGAETRAPDIVNEIEEEPLDWNHLFAEISEQEEESIYAVA